MAVTPTPHNRLDTRRRGHLAEGTGMELTRSTTILLPTIWGFATLTTTRHRALPSATTARVDTVLAPVLTPCELERLHDRLDARPHPTRRARPRLGLLARNERHAVRHAIDVRTTKVLRGDQDSVDQSPLVRILQAMIVVENTTLTVTGEALARELLWGGLHALRDAAPDRTLAAAATLRTIAATACTDFHTSVDDS